MAKLFSNLKVVKALQAKLAALSLQKRNNLLQSLARAIKNNSNQILAANKKDISLLKNRQMTERLVLTDKRIKEMADSLYAVASLPDPLYKTLEKKVLPSGLNLKKISVPLGVVGVIYESRPNVTVELAGLCLKSANAVVLKGGSEAWHTNKILARIMQKVLDSDGLPKNLLYLISPKENWQKTLLTAYGVVDVLIPRGGAELINFVRKNSQIPIIETGAGVCHTLVDASADTEKALKIIVNAKVQRPSVCNALDTLVIHRTALKKLAHNLSQALAEYNVEIFADKTAFNTLTGYPFLRHAKPKDYGYEFLSLKMSIKTVGSFEEGLRFIKDHTSGHSEAILSKNKKHIEKFLKEIDAAVVYANASTRFTDGGEFGMGAEVGISTQKLHARGPMGLETLTSYKWLARGTGQTRK